MNESILDSVPTTGTHQEVIKKLISVLRKLLNDNVHDVPGIDGANIGLAVKLRFLWSGL